MFTGNFIHTIDDKGRVVLPAPIRAKFSGYDALVIAPGVDGQLTLNLPDTYEAAVRAIEDRAENSKDRRRVRHLSNQAVEQKLDKAGRIMVPESLRKHAGITVPSEVMVVGSSSRAEIWEPGLYERDQALAASEFIESELAKEAEQGS